MHQEARTEDYSIKFRRKVLFSQNLIPFEIIFESFDDLYIFNQKIYATNNYFD